MEFALFITRIVSATAIILLVAVILVCIVAPIIFRCSYYVQCKVLFLNYVSFPVEFKSPEKYGLVGSRNLYVHTTDGASLGTWHILPSRKLPYISSSDKLSANIIDSTFDKWLGEGDPIFLYAHGNSMNRGAPHRMELYKILQNNNYHVIAFDYRSYGDSSRLEPSETALVEDLISIYRWVKERAKNSNIFFWGHSLGTGVSSSAVDTLEREGEELTGLVLEAPFNNLADCIRAHPFSKIFHFLPWFEFFFVRPMYENGLRFESDRHLSKVKVPILILHAEDDTEVPINQPKKLFETLQKERGPKQFLEFIPFRKELCLGHMKIYKEETLPEIIRSFVDETLQYKHS